MSTQLTNTVAHSTVIERILAIAQTVDSELDGLRFGVQSPQMVLPFIYVHTDGRPSITRLGANNVKRQTPYDIFLYLTPFGEGRQFVNEIDVYDYGLFLEQAFATRRRLELGTSGGLDYVSDSSFEYVSGLSRPISYPIGSQTQYHGGHYRLTVTTNDFTKQ